MIRAWLFLLWALFTASVYSQEISIVQVNAEWNSRNSIDLNGIRGARVSFGYLEEQPEALRKQIKAVPTVLVFKDGQLIHYWKADLSFKLRVRKEDIQEYIDSIR